MAPIQAIFTRMFVVCVIHLPEVFTHSSYISVNYLIFILGLVSCSFAQGKPDYHKKLNKRELSQIFGVQSHEKGKMIIL